MRSFAAAGLVAALTAATPFVLSAQSSAEERRAKQAADRETQLKKAIGDRLPGKPETCLPRERTISGSTKVPGTALVYQQGRTVYVNRMMGSCPNLRSDSIIITRSTTGQFCRGDIVTLADAYSPGPRGSCVFGDFEPYTRAE